MYWETIQLSQTKKQKIQINTFKLNVVELHIPCLLLDKGQNIIGIDPGVNFGLTFLDSESITITWGKLPRTHKLMGTVAQALAEAMSKPYAHPYWQIQFGDLPHVFIEGPAYSAAVGQPLLEQVRYGFAAGFISNGCEVEYVPPNKARKLAFGHGNKAGKDIWVNINQNGADSIGLAIAGAVLYKHGTNNEGKA